MFSGASSPIDGSVILTNPDLETARGVPNELFVRFRFVEAFW